MRAAVEPVDDQVVTVIEFVRQSPANDTTDNAPRLPTCRIVNRIIRRRAGESFLGHFAVKRLDDVATFAHAAKRRFQPLGKLPRSGRDLLRQSQSLQLLQPARPQGLPERITCGHIRTDVTFVIRLLQQTAIETGEPFLFDFPREVRLNLESE